MPLEKDKENMIQCPYDVAHVIRESRLQFHLVKCKNNYEKQNKSTKYVECPFNSTHKVPEMELNCHKLYLCCDRKKIDTFICSTENVEPLFPVVQYDVACSENWDDFSVPSYDPTEHCKTLPIIMGLPGATPSERKNFRVEQRQRFREVCGTSNYQQPKPVEEVPTEIPTRLPQTKSKTQIDGVAKSNIEMTRGRGRGRILN